MLITGESVGVARSLSCAVSERAYLFINSLLYVYRRAQNLAGRRALTTATASLFLRRRASSSILFDRHSFAFAFFFL